MDALHISISEQAHDVSQSISDLIAISTKADQDCLPNRVVTRIKRLINEAILFVTSDSIELQQKNTENGEDSVALNCLLFYEQLVSSLLITLNSINDKESIQFCAVGDAKQTITTFLFDYMGKYNISFHKTGKLLKRIFILLTRLNTLIVADVCYFFDRLRFYIYEYCKWYTSLDCNSSYINLRCQEQLRDYVALSLVGRSITSSATVPLSAITSASVHIIKKHLSDEIERYEKDETKTSKRRTYEKAIFLSNFFEGFSYINSIILLAQYMHLCIDDDNFIPRVYSPSLLQRNSLCVIIASMAAESIHLRNGGLAMLATIDSFHDVTFFFSLQLFDQNNLSENMDSYALKLVREYIQNTHVSNQLEISICKASTLDAISLSQRCISAIVSCGDSDLRNKSYLSFKRCVKLIKCDKIKFNLLRYLLKECPLPNMKALLIDMIREFATVASTLKKRVVGSPSIDCYDDYHYTFDADSIIAYNESEVASFKGLSPFWSPLLFTSFFSPDIFTSIKIDDSDKNVNSDVAGQAEVFLSFVCLLKFIKAKLLGSDDALCLFVSVAEGMVADEGWLRERRLAIVKWLRPVENVFYSVRHSLASSNLANPQMSLLAHMLSGYE